MQQEFLQDKSNSCWQLHSVSGLHLKKKFKSNETTIIHILSFSPLFNQSLSNCRQAFFCHWQSSGLPVTLLNRVCCCSFYVFWLPYWLMRCPLGISDCWLPMWTQWPRMCVYSHARSDWLWPNNDQSLSYGTGNACRVGSGFNCCRKMRGSHLCVYDWKTCVRVCVSAQMVSGYCEVKESKGKRISSVKGEKHTWEQNVQLQSALSPSSAVQKYAQSSYRIYMNYMNMNNKFLPTPKICIFFFLYTFLHIQIKVTVTN